MYYFQTYCFYVCLLNVIYGTEIFRENREILSEGEEKLKELQDYTLSPYGSCWISVLSDLKTSCPLLNEESHSRLALGFTNCFMQKFKFKPIACDEDADISLCLQHIKSDNLWFTTYLQYHTHTHNMCYFLNHQLWLQKTEKTIKRLTVSSEEVGKRLEESSEKQLELMRLQSDLVSAQKSLVDQSQTLNGYLQNTKTSMVEVFDDFKKATEGQQTLVLDMLNQLSSWIQFLVSHVTSIYTLGFYFVVSTLLFIVTSTPRTCKSRAWLIFLWLSIFLSEFKIKFDPHMLWYARYFGMASSFLLLLYFGAVYKDYETLNNRLLNELYRMVLTQVQGPSVLYQDKQTLVPKHYNFDSQFMFQPMGRSLNASTIREICDDDFGSDSSSDGTYVCDSDRESDESSSSSYCSFSSSAASSRSATPLLNNSYKNYLPALTDTDMQTSNSSSLIPVSAENQPTGYNLRPRRSLGSSTLNNSILLKESPRSFAKFVKVQECNSRVQSVFQTSLGRQLKEDS